jgi:hypothetical protein
MFCEPRPPDKLFHFISLLTSSFSTSPAISYLISSFYSNFEDGPPSYQDSIQVQVRSFSYARPRIRAKFLFKLFVLIFSAVFGAILVALDHFHSSIVPLVSELHADHNFESIGSHDWSSSPCENQCSAHIPELPPRSICAFNSTLVQLRATDKPFHFISPLSSSFPTSSAICCLISPLYSDFESDPLTYQDLNLIQDSSFACARPRIRAKFFPKTLFHLFIAFWAILDVLECFHSPIVTFLPELHADHNFEIIGNRNPSSSFDLILSEPRALDKPFYLFHFPHSLSSLCRPFHF